MKNILVASFLLLFSFVGSSVYAQWATNGATIYNTNSGNVGIGTTDPSSLLDVRGRINLFEIAFRNADGGDDSDPYRLRKVQGNSNNHWLELQLNDDFNESFRIYGNSCVGFGCTEYSGNLYHSFDASGGAFHAGRLGLGTTAPEARLHILDGGFRHGGAGEINIDAPGIMGGRFKILDNGNIG
jgi:hypothetical protein